MRRPWKGNQQDTRALILSFGVGALVFFLGWFLSARGLWGLLVPNAGDETHSFMDLNVITATAGCLSDPTGLDVRGNLCSNWAFGLNAYPPEPYNYPSYWYKSLGALGISSTSTPWVGIFLIILFALSVGSLAFLTLKKSASLKTSVIVLFLSLTPPSLLAMERGNTDIIAFFLIVTSIFFLQLPRNLAAPSVLALAVVFKLFPLGAAVSLLDARKKDLGEL